MKAIIHEIKEGQILVSYEDELHKTKHSLDLADWIKLDYVKLGEADISVDETAGIVTFIKHIGPFKKEEKKEGKKEGKEGKWTEDIVDFEQLLSDAHNKFKDKLSIRTELIHIDWEKKNALFKASVQVGDLIFEGHGDATAENVTGDFIKPHYIRMAESRAIVRALRWATNNATCAEEEK